MPPAGLRVFPLSSLALRLQDGALSIRDTQVEEAGQAIVAKIQRAAELANENCDRAMKSAHKLAMELRAAEDRINKLEADVQVFRERAARAEGWLQTIHQENEQKLITPRSASGSEQRSLP